MRNIRYLLLQILSFIILAPINSSGNNIQVRPESMRIYQGFKTIDHKWPNIKWHGQRQMKYFISNYLFPFTQEPGRYLRPSLVQFFSSYDSATGTRSLDYLQAVEVANHLLPLLEGESKIDILIDSPRSLYPSFAGISLGFLFELHYLENSDLAHSYQIKTLKELVLKKMAPFFAGLTQAPPIDRWENIYLRLMYFYFAKYPSNAALNVYNAMYAFLQNQDEIEWQRNAGANLLLELTLLCDAVCTNPEVEYGSTMQFSREYAMKDLFDACERYCDPASPRGNGFYRTYLTFLENQRDPKLENIRRKLILDDFYGFFKQQPYTIQSWLKNPHMIIPLLQSYYRTELKPFFFTFLALVFFVWPLSYITLILGLLLMSLRRDKITPSTKRMLSKRIPLKRQTIFSNLGDTAAATFKNPLNNLYETLTGRIDPYHTVGLNLLILSATLWFSELREFVTFYGH
ncbi:hypothetical protein [Bdellovibrio bacteriovorus]|uniref:hypothetical protein n=1 Tax=Bdellovibrio bacteriovorus TaxID=959 RepID=UPI0035A992CA